ncbi:MAG TPA: cellulase family glycosylhydrolase [Ktedonobacteraceae bacterium]|nr:cellulase family glycosylhydrolase [Ktedonobacteraceae bacterium]
MPSKGRFRLLLFFVIALFACSTAAITTLRSPTPVRAASLPTGLHVVGNQIEDGSGHVFVPHGVDRMGTEYACNTAGANTDFDGPVDQTAVSAMLSWDINSVRVPLNEDCWLGINGEPVNGKTAAQYQQDIVNWVNLLNQNGLVVILDLHWNNSGTNQSTGQEPMPDLDHAPAFWTSVANTFKSNSSVIFDLYNEPYPGFNNATTTGWSCWLNGSTAANTSPCADVPFAVAGMQTLVNTVRATGATNILMLGGLAYANDLTGWLANEPTDPDHNLAASFHVYNFNACASTSCWSSQVAPVAAKVPVIAGEIGENDCAAGFINTLMPWLDSEGIGYLAWTWTVVDGGTCPNEPVLITDYTGTPTGYGAGYKAHLLALAGGGGSTPTPTSTSGTTPTPTPTNTPTPTPTPPSGGSSCHVVYSIVNQWPGGFQGSLSITNTGSSTINGWTLVFSFANGQTITQIWNASESQSGSQVTVTNLSYDATIGPGATLNSVGFLGNWNGTNTAPASFTLNGMQCS